MGTGHSVEAEGRLWRLAQEGYAGDVIRELAPRCSRGALQAALHVAVSNDHVSAVRALVRVKANVTDMPPVPRREGVLNTPRPLLATAAFYGSVGVVQELVTARCDVNFAPTPGVPPLHDAAMGGQEGAVRELLRHKADAGAVHLCRCVLRGGAAIMALLVQGKASVDARDQRGEPPLSMAVDVGCAETVRVLLQSGARAEDGGDGGRPIHRAAMWGHGAIVELLAQHGADVDAQAGNDRRTALSMAAFRGHTAAVVALLNARASHALADAGGAAPLHLAAQGGNVDTLAALLEAGADCMAVDNRGQAPLAGAAGREGRTLGQEVPFYAQVPHAGRHVLAAEADRQRPESNALILLQHKAQTDHADAEGWTALTHAARHGGCATMHALLAAKSSVNWSSPNGTSILCAAARNGSGEAVKLVLEAKADLHHENAGGYTALDYAAMALADGAIQALVAAKSHVNHRDVHGVSPLLRAAVLGVPAAVQALLQAKADLEQADMFGRTPLAGAVRHGYDSNIVLLLEANADVHRPDADGFTPLQVAMTLRGGQHADLLHRASRNQAERARQQRRRQTTGATSRTATGQDVHRGACAVQ